MPDRLTDNNYGAAVWSAIECNIGVVCASLPTFKSLIDHFFPSLMGHSRGPSKVTPPEAFAAGKRGYIRKASQSELELEAATGWRDSYAGNYGGDVNYNSSATADGRPLSGTNNSEEQLRSVEPHGKDTGIWKSTSVVVSHGGRA